jgi:membrane protein DedA with SNARE-associated domain
VDASKVATLIIDSVSSLPAPAAYATIVGILVICGFGIPIPEDITLLVAGLLAAGGSTTLTGSLVAGFIGVLFGDAVLFFLGRKFGKRIFKLPGFRRLFTPDRVEAAEARIRRNGPFICFIARFLPGLRSPVFAMAGALGVRPLVFFSLDGFAAAISVPVWVYLGYWFGNNIEEAYKRAEHIQMFIFGGIIIVASLYLTWRLWRRKKAKSKVGSVTPSVTHLEERGRIRDRNT